MGRRRRASNSCFFFFVGLDWIHDHMTICVMGGGVVRKRSLCYIMKRIGGGYGMIGRCLSLFGLDGFGCFYYGNHAMFTRTALAITRSGLVWSGLGRVRSVSGRRQERLGAGSSIYRLVGGSLFTRFRVVFFGMTRGMNDWVSMSKGGRRLVGFL